jgi:hypothetical protein
MAKLFARARGDGASRIETQQYCTRRLEVEFLRFKYCDVFPVEAILIPGVTILPEQSVDVLGIALFALSVRPRKQLKHKQKGVG